MPKAFVEALLVPPGHPLKRHDFNLENVVLGPSMDQLVLIGAIDVLSKGVI